jgi:8-oxo-dGTP diphosphatase
MRVVWRPEVCVGAAIFRGDRILLLRRSSTVAYPGLWEMPGGHVEPGEGLEAALRREVREETGYALVVGRPFHAWTFRYPRGPRRAVETVEIDFYGTIRSHRDPRLDPREHTNFAWVTEPALRDFPTDRALDRVHRTAFGSRREIPS